MRFIILSVLVFSFCLYAKSGPYKKSMLNPYSSISVKDKNLDSNKNIGYSWEQKTPSPTAFARGSFALINGKFYVFSRTNNIRHAYDYSANSWTEVTNDPGPNLYSTFGDNGTKLYCWGGANPMTAVLRIYDTTSDKWDSFSDPHPFGSYIYAGRAFPLDSNRMFIIPGSTSTTMDVASNKCYIYNISTATYTQAPDMPFALYGFAAIKDGNQIVVLGGKNTAQARTKYCLIYYISSSTWVNLAGAYLPEDTWQGAVVKTGNSYYYIGGGNGNSSDPCSNKVYRWNGSTWAQDTNLPYYGGTIAAVSPDNNRILIFGGLGSPSNPNNGYPLNLCYMSSNTGIRKLTWGEIKQTFIDK
ncbi:MAG: hypothetical protein JXA60_02245 [Candidatus Coatesbacteria bacterium]|nr:hypothetical protein [Candidatus Coatesbacteria bacterium]